MYTGVSYLVWTDDADFRSQRVVQTTPCAWGGGGGDNAFDDRKVTPCAHIFLFLM